MKKFRILQAAMKTFLCCSFILSQFQHVMACEDKVCDGSCEAVLGAAKVNVITSRVRGEDFLKKEQEAKKDIAKGLLICPISCAIPKVLYGYFKIQGLDLFPLNPLYPRDSEKYSFDRSLQIDIELDQEREHAARVKQLTKRMAEERDSDPEDVLFIEEAEHRVYEGERLGQLGILDQAIKRCGNRGNDLLKRAHLELHRAILIRRDVSRNLKKNPIYGWQNRHLEEALLKPAATLYKIALQKNGKEGLPLLQAAAAILHLPLNPNKRDITNNPYPELHFSATGELAADILSDIADLHREGVDSHFFLDTAATACGPYFSIYVTRHTDEECAVQFSKACKKWAGRAIFQLGEWRPRTHPLITRSLRNAVRTLLFLARARS